MASFSGGWRTWLVDHAPLLQEQLYLKQAAQWLHLSGGGLVPITSSRWVSLTASLRPL